jgi:hypothetical protein
MPDLSRVQISPEVGVSTCQMHIKNIQILARDIHTLLFRSARLLGKPLSRTHTMSVKLCRVSLRGAFPQHKQVTGFLLTVCTSVWCSMCLCVLPGTQATERPRSPSDPRWVC